MIHTTFFLFICYPLLLFYNKYMPLILCSGTGRDNAERGDKYLQEHAHSYRYDRARPQVAVTAASVVVGAGSDTKAVGGSLRPFKNTPAQQKVVRVHDEQSVHEQSVQSVEDVPAVAAQPEKRETREKGKKEKMGKMGKIGKKEKMGKKRKEFQFFPATRETVAVFVERVCAAELDAVSVSAESLESLESVCSVHSVHPVPAVPSIPLPPQRRHRSPRHLWHSFLAKFSRRSV